MMKFTRTLFVALVVSSPIALPVMVLANAGQDHPAANAASTGELVAVTEKDAAWVAKEKEKYPTTQCIVSEDKLGADMGKPADFIYREAGKPDRLVSFCCKDCVKDFNKDPQKYLKILDEAAAQKSGAHAEHKS